MATAAMGLLEATLGGILWGRRLAHAVRARIGALGLPMPALSIGFDAANASFADALITRRGRGHLQVILPGNAAAIGMRMAEHRLPCVVALMARCPDSVRSLNIDLSDGDRSSNADFCFSGIDRQRALLPDPDFFNTGGYANVRLFAENTLAPWDRRAALVRWRGGANGDGALISDPAAAFDMSVMQRARLCIIAAQTPGIDARIVQNDGGPDPLPGAAGITGERLAETAWIGDKYAIDIDGHTNSWSNFLVRLHLGCCVFKVASAFGYRQWYYDRIEPWRHFVPVRADMRDLADKIGWAAENPDKAREIAAAGQDFARTMTLESEMAQAVRTVTAHAAR